MQILVAVANIQMRTLKAEAEKVFVRTAVVHESVSPKAIANASMTGVRGLGSRGQLRPRKTCADAEREVGPTFRHQAAGDEKWQHAFGDPHDAAMSPWKSSLFFLMRPQEPLNPVSYGDMVLHAVKPRILSVVGCTHRCHGKVGGDPIQPLQLAVPNNRIRSPRQEASSR